jgi:uncharacterized coiled-coil protein SlyX
MPDAPERITLAVLNEQLRYLIQRVDALMVRVEHQAESSHARDMAMAMIQQTLDRLPPLETRLGKAEDTLKSLTPWVSGVRWVALIVGGLLVVGLFAGLIWAAVQSGGLLP